MKKIKLLFFVLFICASNNILAQLYVNPSTGSDANNGTSLATAKQSLRGALRVLPAPNTTIFIVGGDYPYSTMTNNANRSLGFGPGQSVTTGINNANLPGTIIEGMGCVYWHNSNDDGTGDQNPIMTVEAVNGFTVRNINFLGWQGTNASMMFINCNNVRIENCTFHQSALNSATALRFDGDATETTIAANTTQNYFVDGCTFQNNGNPSGQGTGQALYIRNNGASVGTGTFNVDIRNSKFVCNFAATGGALYSQAVNAADKHPNVTISGCSFSGNTASSQGGAIFSKYSNFNISGTSFCNNNAGGALSDRDGGAIHTDQGSNLIVADCAFADNVAGRYGSAISVASNSLVTTISNSTFISNNLGNSTNSVVRTGGGTTTIDNCLFKDNATNALLGTITTTNSSFIGNPGSAVSGTNVYDSQTASGVWADALGHYFQPSGNQVGFTGAYATIDVCPPCPTKPIAGECKANAGVSLSTNSTCFYICSDTTSGADISNTGSINITNVAGWTKPCDLSSSYHYYFLVVDAGGIIKKVVDGDADSDGIPNFAETPSVNTNVDLSGITPPGNYKVVGFYTTGSAPTIGTSAATAAATGCSSLSGGSIGFTVLTAVRIRLSDSCLSSTGTPAPAGQFYASIDSVYGGFADLNSAFFTPRSYTLTTNFGTGTYIYTGTPIKDILVNFVASGQITAQATTYTPQPSNLCSVCQSQVFAKDHKGCFTLSGNVYNDVNGLNTAPINTVDGTPIYNPDGNQLYANLLNSSNQVIATVPVSTLGTYLFEGLGAATYTVQLSTVQGVLGQPMPATSLPTGWVNTGENLGASAGNDGTVNGILPAITITNANVINANFGIEHKPTANNAIEVTQFNPAGLINLTVNSTLFGGTDLSGGIIDSLIILTFPSNITSITINGMQYTSSTWPSGGVVVPTNSIGQPTQPITFDPLDSVTSVIIPYFVFDNAGVLSDLAGSVELPLTTISLTGNVFNDANGLNDVGGGIVNGMGTNVSDSLYAILVDASGNVVANSEVSASGQYSFAVGANTNYTVRLATMPGLIGTPASGSSLPPTWHNVGENIGTGIGNDGATNGAISVSVLTSNISNVNFGIDQEPNSIDYSTIITAASLGIILPLDGTGAPSVISVFGNDPESGSLGGTNTVVITSLPTNGVMEYNGNPITLNTPILNFNPSLLTITLNVSGSTSTSFTFAFVDPAGIQDPSPATYTITWALPLPVTFISFTGRTINHGINKLNWKVAYEKNLNYYEVQKSTNGLDYSTIGSVNVNNSQNYDFTDLKAFDNTNYYRLKSVDFDSKIQLSAVVVLSNNNASKMITIYPNPASDQLSVQFNSTKVKSFDIVDVAGKKIIYMVNDKNVYNISQLASGMYEIVIPGYNTVKFIKK